ncbi:ABC transporter permease [Thermococcus camini]|uniref:ABC-type multidrug transport system, permease component n=1 Tax=Thermococcus camini TaxID=2016373 RepID=A0A7G2DAP3_9EURY|nr:ABC transporter permease [Thermococcus camini]CAD5244078.1 ABC-type multidrug transport system, permease component [Thermococcus camini]
MKVVPIMAKELREYLLKPGSISWGLIFPLVFTLSFIVRFGDIDHLAPGLVSISALFATTSFVASSLIFERRLKTFERLLLAPVSYGEIILAKVLVGALFGLMVSLITLALVRYFMVYPVWSWPLTVAFVLLANLTFSALGVYVSLAVENPINVMTWLNVIRLPMIFTSGALASLTLFPAWFMAIGLLTPMTYSVEGLRYALLGYYDVVPPLYSLSLLLLIALGLILLSVRALRKAY